MKYKCAHCKKELNNDEAYEYRGVFACAEHFDIVVENRDRQRAEIIQEEDAKTKCFKGLDLSESSIGKANRKLLRKQIEIASKESIRLKKYERPED